MTSGSRGRLPGSCRNAGILGIIARVLRGLLHDESGAEVVQFALVIPALVGVVWASIEFWQIMSLRSAIRMSVSQTARYITAYGAQPNLEREPYEPLPTGDVCNGLYALIDRSLSSRRGNLGDSVSWGATFYRVNNPADPAWEGNVVPVGSCNELLENLLCNEQFAVRLTTSVPWRTVFFGLSSTTRRDFSLNMSDTAVGAGPCLPYCEIRNASLYRDPVSEGPGGCDYSLQFELDCDFIPTGVEVWVDYQPVPLSGADDLSQRSMTLKFATDAGDNDIRLVILGGRRRIENPMGSQQCWQPG